MKRRECEALTAKEKSLRPLIKNGDEVFVKKGNMAGSYSKVHSMDADYVYLRHQVTNIEYRCLIGDVEVFQK